MDEQQNSDDQQENEEVYVQEEEDLGGEGAAQQTVKKLRQKIKNLKEEKKGQLDELQRLKAEFLNARRRDEERKKEEIANANEQLILELLPVIDSFEMAFADKKAYEATPENWRKGVDYIYSQLLSILETHGVEQFHPIDKPFDPNFHDAIDQVSVDDEKKDGQVVDVIQKGYTLNNKVIRSAKVRVAVFQKEEE